MRHSCRMILVIKSGTHHKYVPSRCMCLGLFQPSVPSQHESGVREALAHLLSLCCTAVHDLSLTGMTPAVERGSHQP